MAVEISVQLEKRKHRYLDRTPGYAPSYEERTLQELVVYRVNKWGRMIVGKSRTVLGYEVIPDHVLISMGCFGDTGGWRSRFVDLATAQTNFVSEKKRLDWIKEHRPDDIDGITTQQMAIADAEITFKEIGRRYL